MPRELILIATALLTWGFGEGLFLFFQPLYLQSLGANPVQIGAILGGWGAAMTISHLPAGYLADRIGRRPLLVAAWLVGTTTAWLMATARSLPVFTAALILYGLTSFVVAPLNSYITAARGKLSVARAITLISAAFNTGAILGPRLGGYIADRAGLQSIYLVSASIFTFSTLFIFFIKPQAVEKAYPISIGRGFPIQKPFMIFLLVIFLTMFALYLPQPLASNFLQDQHGFTFGQIGQLGSLSSLGIVFMNLALGQIDARLGFLIAQAAVGAFALALWKGSGMPLFMAAYFLLGGYRAARSLATALSRNLVHASKMGLAYGLVETAAGGAMFLAPPLAGIIYRSNPYNVFGLSAAMVVVSLAAGAVYFFRRDSLLSPAASPGSNPGEVDS
jgi:MFS family permease